MRPTAISKGRFKRAGALMFTLAFVFSACVIFTGRSEAGDDPSERALGIRDRREPFQVSLEPLRPSYRVGEPIRLRVRGNRDFFLYLFSINREEGRALRLIPSDRQRGNKYRADLSHVIPNRSVEFYCDRPGVEQIVMLASTRYLELKAESYRKFRGFFVLPPEAAGARIKALGVRGPGGKGGRVVKELTIRIVAPVTAPAAPLPTPIAPYQAPRAMAFVSCDRETYRVGDRVRVIYGADRPGWIHLHTVGPDGSRTLLKKERVSGKEIYHLTARAERPSGRHALVAAYSEGANPGTRSFPLMPGEKGTKGLSLIPPDQPPLAVCRFNIIGGLGDWGIEGLRKFYAYCGCSTVGSGFTPDR